MEKRGKNIALYDEDSWQYTLYFKAKKPSYCVFISHKKEDEEAAITIGNYIIDQGINIYLDLQDCVLQEAVSLDNDALIVKSIKKGLKACSHLLCLVSDKTKLSWWVPYEIGTAAEQEKKITSLKLKGNEDIPSFLKTEQILLNKEDFIGYVNSIPLIEKREFNYDETLALDEYIDV